MDWILGEVLEELKNMHKVLENRANEYLDEKYLRLLLKKIAILEYELNSKYISLSKNKLEDKNLEENLEVHRRR